MERLVVWVLKRDILQSFVLLIKPIPNNLDLWLMWDRLEVGVQDRALGIKCLAMAIVLGGRVKTACKFKLSFWGETALVLEDYNVVVVECFSNSGEVCVTEVLDIDIVDLDTKVDG